MEVTGIACEVGGCALRRVVDRGKTLKTARGATTDYRFKGDCRVGKDRRSLGRKKVAAPLPPADE